MGHEMRNLFPRPPYNRLNSNVSGESAPEANQGETAPRTTKIFDSARQTRTILFKETLRWIGTLIFTALIAVTLRIYEGKRSFPSDQKIGFNVIITALILGCGLNLFVTVVTILLKQSAWPPTDGGLL